LGLGATEVEEIRPGGDYIWTNMLDVEGNEFCVSTGAELDAVV
jgi:hypothetical protein